MRVLLLLLGAIVLSPAASAQEAHHRLLAIPYVGTQLFTGQIRPTEERRYPDPGLGVRAGGLIGFRALPAVSLNGELSVDWMNLDSTYGDGTTGLRASLSLAPLYHIAPGQPFELMIGPKLGVWRQDFRNSDPGLQDGERGYLWGLNAAGFVRLRTTLFGALFGFENAVRTERCYGNGFCYSMSGITPERIFTFNVAASF